jgi:transcriptional regulator with XRE-family HTH domain
MYNDDKKFRVIGQRIKKLREERGWSQEVLASQLGIVRSYLADLERGRQKPGTVMVWALSHFLGVSMIDIIGKEIGFYNNKEREFFLKE